MSELGSQILVSDETWKRVPGIREKCEAMLRESLEEDGCHDITFTEPQYRLQESTEDTELRFEPYWAWEMMATGEKDE